MDLKLTNNATGRLAISLSTSDTTVVLQPGDGSRFPTLSAGDWFPLTVLRADNTREIMYVTARSADTLTVTRAKEGTAPISFIANDRAELRATAGVFSNYLPLAGGAITGNLAVGLDQSIGGGLTVQGAVAAGGAGHPPPAGGWQWGGYGAHGMVIISWS